MPPIPDPPAGSAIERREESEGMRLAWPVPAPGAGRYLFAAFLAPFVCGWAAGIVSVLHTLLTGGALLLLGWLAGWLCAGFWVPFGLWIVLRPLRPESVLMGGYEFAHDPGWSPALYYRGLMLGVEPVIPRGAVSVPRTEAAFALDGGRLTFEYEGKQVEIGPRLREEDREWLFTVLENWRQGRG